MEETATKYQGIEINIATHHIKHLPDLDKALNQ